MVRRAQHPTQPAGVPGGCGGSERRIRACYNAGRANQRIRATQVVRHKHICASSERRAATATRRVRLPSLGGTHFRPESATQTVSNLFWAD